MLLGLADVWFRGKADNNADPAQCLPMVTTTLLSMLFISPTSAWPRSSAVLRVADVFQPVDDFAVERFRNRNVRHRCCRRRAVPVLLARREPDDVARPYLLDRSALTLREAAAGRHDQCLAQRMRLPGRARAGLERDAGAADARRIGRLEHRVDADRAGEPLRRPLA